MTYQLALAITLAIEIPVVAAVFRGQRARMAFVCLLATTATHLTMHFVVPRFVTNYESFIIVGETLATLAEAATYILFSKPRRPGAALIASALANALSYAAGLVLSPLW